MTNLRIGIAGLGTVGGGVIKLLAENSLTHSNRSGRSLHISAASALEMPNDIAPLLEGVEWFDNAIEMAKSTSIDVVVELIGGEEGVALKLVEAAISSGKSVVTANKALIANHGNELSALAENNGVALLFEAAVAGGIPIVKTLKRV